MSRHWLHGDVQTRSGLADQAGLSTTGGSGKVQGVAVRIFQPAEHIAQCVLMKEVIGGLPWEQTDPAPSSREP
jgi:hypothetical protein